MRYIFLRFKSVQLLRLLLLPRVDGILNFTKTCKKWNSQDTEAVGISLKSPCRVFLFRFSPIKSPFELSSKDSTQYTAISWIVENTNELGIDQRSQFPQTLVGIPTSARRISQVHLWEFLQVHGTAVQFLRTGAYSTNNRTEKRRRRIINHYHHQTPILQWMRTLLLNSTNETWHWCSNGKGLCKHLLFISSLSDWQSASTTPLTSTVSITKVGSRKRPTRRMNASNALLLAPLFDLWSSKGK